MKNRKWLTYTLGTLLTLIVLAVVAGVSIRIGMTQNPSFARQAFARGFFNGAPQVIQRNFQGNDNPQSMQGNPHDNGWTQMRGNPQNRGFNINNRSGNRRGGMDFFPPIFGLIRLVVLGLVIAVLGWLGYTLMKKSGWKLTHAEEAASAPSASETADVVIEK
jgi:hypothetical protein